MNVLIASPLEAEFAARIGSLDVVGTLAYEPDLLNVPRYPNDHAGTARTRSAADEAHWSALVRAADVIFGYPDESADGLRATLAAGPAIRFVQGTSAGMGAHVRRAHLDDEMLARVAFASAAGVHAGMLAEFAFYGLLALRKDAGLLASLRERRAWEHVTLGELDGSTVAIVGMGQIGRAFAIRARAFGMHVIGVNRRGEPDPVAHETHATSALVAIAPRCTALVITLPITEQTRNLVSARVIEALPATAIIVNVGRGAVLDEAALIAALQASRLAGAVLDVFSSEPLPSESPLWSLQNVVLAPHTAGLSRHENARIVDLFCENLRRFARGDALRNRVNLVEFY